MSVPAPAVDETRKSAVPVCIRLLCVVCERAETDGHTKRERLVIVLSTRSDRSCGPRIYAETSTNTTAARDRERERQRVTECRRGEIKYK